MALPFTQQDLEQWDPSRRVSTKRAHALLAQLRAQMSAIREQRRDMTYNAVLWDYVCGHPEAANIVGPGITQLEVIALGAIDQNTRDLRHDFVISRIDGSAVRLHPSQKSAGVPAEGTIAQWLHPRNLEASPAAARGSIMVAHGGKGSGSGFVGRHQQDVLGRNDARVWLDRATKQWQESPHPRAFSENLFDGRRFPWWLYLCSTQWGKQLAPRVTDFHLVWLRRPHNRAAFHVSCGQEEFIIDPLSNRKIPFEPLASLPANTVSWE